MSTRGLAARLDATLLDPQATLADVTPTNGVDLAGHAGAAVLLQVEAGGSQGTADLTIQESDTAITGPYTTVADADLEIPSGVLVGDTNGGEFDDADAGSHFFGYHGGQRFLRAIISGTAGTPDFGAALSIVLGWPRRTGGTP